MILVVDEQLKEFDKAIADYSYLIMKESPTKQLLSARAAVYRLAGDNIKALEDEKKANQL